MELAFFVISLITSAALTRWVRDLAITLGWVSSPQSRRHVHVKPVPRLGGVGIFLTLWAMTLVARFLPEHLGVEAAHWTHFTVGILGPATVVFLLGLLDDFRRLNAYLKFGVQVVAAVLLYLNGFGISLVSWTSGSSSVGWMIGFPLTILWALWITNAFNLIDGLDGLAAGSALFSTLVICVIALLGHNKTILFLTLVLAGAIIGFLRYNFNPASIFLGDCGSLLIGFLVSAIALAGSQKSTTIVAVAIPLVSLGLPILDVTVAVIRRFLSRQPLFGADREHIHHRLISRGVPHRQAVLILYGVSGVFGLVSLLLLSPGGRTVGIVLAVLAFGILVGLQQLRFHEFFELKHIANRTLNIRLAIANNVSIARATEALRCCETTGELCLILQKCLMPIGFDGFGFYLLSDLPDHIECFPFERVNGHKFHFVWESSLAPSDANWSFTFALQNNGNRVGGFSLYRKNNQSPLWMDLNVFTSAGFSSELARVIRRIQSGWVSPSYPKPSFSSHMKS